VGDRRPGPDLWGFVGRVRPGQLKSKVGALRLRADRDEAAPAAPCLPRGTRRFQSTVALAASANWTIEVIR
jgi:hypothetical protein